ncbi:hypothetical protein O4J56_09775 [Nocardiopsis sp. RSe5-2]|uniref:Uncharacterized protein n=1 Tax=Nocardiopsis endophytica TaxID=3018445 RepID=A0ABT4U1W5_9ACTN|nr:hypothetical protein [Nocardiopsis endophytica]MDA2810923.1 hypothetical protein [Nocardiopsis endophytica]
MRLAPIDVGDVAAAVAAAVALAALAISWWNAASAGGSRRAAEASAKHAARAAQAADVSAEAARRTARADETMARLAQEEADRYVVPWRIEHDQGSRYRLVHDDDTGTALDVSVEGECVHGESREALGPRETMTFRFVPTMGGSRDVIIRWRRPSDDDGELRAHATQPPAPR